MVRKLDRWSTEELETAIFSGSLDALQFENAPYRRLVSRTYSAAAWTLAFALGTFIVALAVFWLIATGYRLP